MPHSVVGFREVYCRGHAGLTVVETRAGIVQEQRDDVGRPAVNLEAALVVVEHFPHNTVSLKPVSTDFLQDAAQAGRHGYWTEVRGVVELFSRLRYGDNVGAVPDGRVNTFPQASRETLRDLLPRTFGKLFQQGVVHVVRSGRLVSLEGAHHFRNFLKVNRSVECRVRCAVKNSTFDRSLNFFVVGEFFCCWIGRLWGIQELLCQRLELLGDC